MKRTKYRAPNKALHEQTKHAAALELDTRVLLHLKSSTFDRTDAGLAHDLREDIFEVKASLKWLHTKGLVQRNEIRNPLHEVSAVYWWATERSE